MLDVAQIRVSESVRALGDRGWSVRSRKESNSGDQLCCWSCCLELLELLSELLECHLGSILVLLVTTLTPKVTRFTLEDKPR